MNKYYSKYLKYKQKYFLLKNNSILPELAGGSLSENPIFFNKVINKNEKYYNKLNEYLHKIISSKNENNELRILVDSLVLYIQNNDLPIDYTFFDIYDIDELLKAINELKSKLSVEYLDKLYKIREHIYTLDENNYDEILDYIIDKYHIKNENDIIKLFSQNILGNDKNNIIYYLVLFRFLIKNNRKITKDIDMLHVSSFPYGNEVRTLSQRERVVSLQYLENMLLPANNSEDYLPIMVELINKYIMINPIKKILNVNNSSNKLAFRYHAKNRVIEYVDGALKNILKIDFYDLHLLLFTLSKI